MIYLFNNKNKYIKINMYTFRWKIKYNNIFTIKKKKELC